MFAEEVYNRYYEKARTLFELRKSFDEIDETLKKEGAESLMAAEIVAQIRAVHYAKKRKRGTQTVLFGSIFLLIGFIFTCTCFHSDLPLGWAMYGFTSLGLIIMFIGLIDIFG